MSREFAAGCRPRYARLAPLSLGSLALLVPLSRAFRGSRWLFPCRFAPLPLYRGVNFAAGGLLSPTAPAAPRPLRGWLHSVSPALPKELAPYGRSLSPRRRRHSVAPCSATVASGLRVSPADLAALGDRGSRQPYGQAPAFFIGYALRPRANSKPSAGYYDPALAMLGVAALRVHLRRRCAGGCAGGGELSRPQVVPLRACSACITPPGSGARFTTRGKLALAWRGSSGAPFPPPPCRCAAGRRCAQSSLRSSAPTGAPIPQGRTPVGSLRPPTAVATLQLRSGTKPETRLATLTAFSGFEPSLRESGSRRGLRPYRSKGGGGRFAPFPAAFSASGSEPPAPFHFGSAAAPRNRARLAPYGRRRCAVSPRAAPTRTGARSFVSLSRTVSLHHRAPESLRCCSTDTHFTNEPPGRAQTKTIKPSRWRGRVVNNN